MSRNFKIISVLVIVVLVLLWALVLRDSAGASHTPTITNDVLVLKIKVYTSDGEVWLRTQGWFAMPCGTSQTDHDVAYERLPDTDEFTHHYKITVTYPTPAPDNHCVEYVNWGYYFPAGEDIDRNGTHLFWVNNRGQFKTFK